MGVFTFALLTLSLLTFTISAIPTISVKGSKFFANGQQFFIKGVAYQGTPSDPLVDVTQCTADATLMQTLGTNSIRVYHVNPYMDHSGCMNVFASFGIYIWLDLDTFNTTIPQDAPTWNSIQFQAFTQVMDAFHAFDNLAGFWIGNEVISTAAGSPAAPFIKAAVADMKAYAATKNYRPIPIGYSAADIAELRPMLQNYLTCSASTGQNIDFFGLNSYEWCGASTYQTSGYNNLQAQAAAYPVPIFFSETGCNVPPQRSFADQSAIFGPDMANTWSGSIVYEWVQETNNYGLVSYPNGVLYGVPTPIQPDFSNLAGQWKTVSPSAVAQAAYTPRFPNPPCPAATPGGWLVDGDPPIPTLGAAVVSAVAASQRPSPTVVFSRSGAATGTGTVVVGGAATATVAVGASGRASLSPSDGAGAATAGASATSSAVGARRTGEVGLERLVGVGVGILGALLI